MNDDVLAAYGRLVASGEAFDQALRVLKAERKQAVPVLVELLHHPDAAWNKGAAAALARMKATPAAAVPTLVRLVASKDASLKIAAMAALEWAPPRLRSRAIPAVMRVLGSRPVEEPVCTRLRAHMPRAVAAHWLSLHGGRRGQVVLAHAARSHNDPVAHHISGALGRMIRVQARKRRARRRTSVSGLLRQPRSCDGQS
jgi:hypothetical protein